MFRFPDIYTWSAPEVRWARSQIEVMDSGISEKSGWKEGTLTVGKETRKVGRSRLQRGVGARMRHPNYRHPPAIPSRPGLVFRGCRTLMV